jgi:hemerythrin-like domain-containing protein
MQATDILMNEHRVIERVLDALETATWALERGAAVRPGFFLEAADFIAGFADGCHHRKEEGVLFEAMIAAGMPPQGGPIAVMLAEHEQGRRLTRGIREGVKRWQEGAADGHRVLTTNAREYIALLREHIRTEDDVLFPMAEEIIPPAREAAVLRDYERVAEAAACDLSTGRSIALAGQLAREAQGYQTWART